MYFKKTQVLQYFKWRKLKGEIESQPASLRMSRKTWAQEIRSIMFTTEVIILFKLSNISFHIKLALFIEIFTTFIDLFIFKL